MFRLLLGLALLAGSVVYGVSHMNDQTIQRVQSLLQEIGIGTQATPQASAATGDQPQGADQRREQPVHISEPLPRAFYGTPPEECAWEKIIDPSDGSVRCALMERNTRQTGR